MTWMLTASGRDVDLRFLPADDIRLHDIAHSLAHINRFNGHAKRPYSVAEHSLLVAEIALRELGLGLNGQYAALLHDAHEAYTGDLSSPMKQLIGQAWADVEHRVQQIVLAQLGAKVASSRYRDEVRRADLIALATERRDLMHPAGPDWHLPPPVDWIDLNDRAGMAPADWRDAFVAKVEELDALRKARMGGRG